MFLLNFLTVLISCKKDNVIVPPAIPYIYLINTLPLSDTVMKNMEGIYALADGRGDLGTEFVCKVSKSKVSFFSNSGGIYIILQYGLDTTDGAIKFAGFWRYSESTLQGLINFSVAAGEGGSDLLTSGIARQLTLKENFSGNNGARLRTPQGRGLKTGSSRAGQSGARLDIRQRYRKSA